MVQVRPPPPARARGPVAHDPALGKVWALWPGARLLPVQVGSGRLRVACGGRNGCARHPKSPETRTVGPDSEIRIAGLGCHWQPASSSAQGGASALAQAGQDSHATCQDSDAAAASERRSGSSSEPVVRVTGRL